MSWPLTTVTTDMVALNESRRLVLQGDMATNDTRSTKTKMVPRTGPTTEWSDEMADIMATEKLTTFASESPPTLQRIESALPGIDKRLATEMLDAALTTW